VLLGWRLPCLQASRAALATDGAATPSRSSRAAPV